MVSNERELSEIYMYICLQTPVEFSHKVQGTGNNKNNNYSLELINELPYYAGIFYFHTFRSLLPS